MSSLKEKLNSLPLKPGVYLFKDKNGAILYVGKARSLKKRVSSYFQRPADIKTSILLDRLSDIDYIVAGSEMDALLLEDELIKKYKPRYNISLRDDKAYPYLKLTVKEEWPRLFLARRKTDDGSLYFGPYQGAMVRSVIRQVKKLFPIRWCKESPLKKREQPCLYYRIRSCSGPCIGRIDRDDYMRLVQGIVLLLQGKMDASIEKLKEEMARASLDQDYEKAAALRDRIRLFDKMLEGKGLAHAPSPRRVNELDELQKILGLKSSPMRIEGFDISNLQGRETVGSMVAFFGGLPLRRDYRRFCIRSVKGKPNDVAAIFEIVKRRYAGTLSNKLAMPDLILIDGGKPQISAAGRALADAGIAGVFLISLAKRNEEIFTLRRLKPICLAKGSLALRLIQRVRDEAHRFAVTYHRLKRKKAFYR